MKDYPNHENKIISFVILILSSQLSIINSQTIRPIRDNIGFCWDAGEMNHFVNYLSENSGKVKEKSKNLVAAISVHDAISTREIFIIRYTKT